jgi:5-hydroxyisourate hydrolase-like protein (transthyretin family)
MHRRAPRGSAVRRSVGVRIAAILGALALIGGGGLVGASAASAASTFTVTGTVPVGAGGSVQVVAFDWVASDDDWEAGSATTTANVTTGAFSIKLAAGSVRHTLGFIPDHLPYQPTILGGLADLPDTNALGASVFSGAANSTKAVGAVTLLPGGVIEGVVTDPSGAAVPDAQVEAFTVGGSGGGNSSRFVADTSADGSYYLSVSATAASYELVVDADGFESTFYPSTTNESDAEDVTVDATSSFHRTAIDVQLVATRPSLLADYAKGRSAEFYLYRLTNGVVTSPVPVASDSDGDDFLEADELDPGQYGVAFRDPKTGEWEPWLSYTGAGSLPGATGGSSSCILPVTITATHDVSLGDVTLGTPSTTCSAPWGTASSWSGTVTNFRAGEAITATLYRLDASGNAIAVNHAEVGPGGAYSIDGVADAGEYFSYFAVDDSAPFLDTWSDGEDATQDASFQHVVDTTPSIPANADSPGHDVAMVAAVFLTGVVRTADGAPIANAVVEADAASDDDDYFDIASTDASGRWSIPLSAHRDVVLTAYASGYADQSWNHVADPDDATVVRSPASGTAPTSYDFSLTPTSTEIGGIVIKIDAAGQPAGLVSHLSASLYKEKAGTWKKIATQDATNIEGVDSIVDFTKATGTALSSGNYRMRFHAASGWIAIGEYEEGSASVPPTGIVPGPVCFIPIPHVQNGEQRIVLAVVTPSSASKTCHDEPSAQSHPHSSGGGSSTSSWVNAAPAASVTGTTPSASATPTPTPSATTPVPTPSPSASDSTPAPGASAANPSSPVDFGWLFWVIGGVGAVIVIGGIWLLLARRSA